MAFHSTLFMISLWKITHIHADMRRWAQNLSPDAKDLLLHLLDVDPNSRYTAEQALNHCWVTGKAANKGVLLQSPQMMRDLPRLQETPQTPQHVRDMAAKMRQQSGQASTYGSSLNPIHEEELSIYYCAQSASFPKFRCLTFLIFDSDQGRPQEVEEVEEEYVEAG